MHCLDLAIPPGRIDLLKMRGGSTGSWIMQWRNGQLAAIENNQPNIIHEIRKVG